MRSGEEIGLQVAAYLNGELVIDTWAGLMAEGRGRPVNGDTLFSIFSVGKGIAATAIHIAAERGLIDYDKPIAHYWPEFAAHGKGAATVRHALTHRVGVPYDPIGWYDELGRDWDRVCARIADTAPVWEPGTRLGYHSMTYGWIVGEILRRADGRPIDRFVREELAAPLGIGSLFLGLPPALNSRVATLAAAPPGPGSSATTTQGGSWADRARLWNTPELRSMVQPAIGGIANARAIARHYAMLAQGGMLDGVRILPASRVATATAFQTDGPDVLMGRPTPRALGYSLPRGEGPIKGSAFGHGGLGGATGLADPTRRFAFSLLKNRLMPTPLDPSTPVTAGIVCEITELALGIA